MSNQTMERFHYKTGLCAFVSEFLYRVTERGGKGCSVDFLHKLAQEYYGAVIDRQSFMRAVLDGGDKINNNNVVNIKLAKRWDKFTKYGYRVYPKTWSFVDIPDEDLQRLERRIHRSGETCYSMVPAHWDDDEKQRMSDIKAHAISAGCSEIDFKREIFKAWKDVSIYEQKPNVTYIPTTKDKLIMIKNERKRVSFLLRHGYKMESIMEFKHITLEDL